MHCSSTRLVSVVLCWGVVCSLGFGQAKANQFSAPKVSGVFVNPVPGAPFSATVELVSKQTLPDGSVVVLKTIDSIARDTRGRTRNETRRFVAESYQGEPPVSRIYIYDPVAGLSMHLDPFQLIATQTKTNTAPAPKGSSVPLDPNDPNSPIKEVDLGTRTLQNLTLHGIRQSRSAEYFDEYWYSPELSIYMIRKHHNPIWEQTVTVTQFDRSEPDAARFAVADGYKIVAEAEDLPQASLVRKLGGGVLPPQLVYAPDPEYSEQARRAKYSGIAIVSAVVDVEGHPKQVHVIKHLDMGLDDKAIAAVQQYRFRPATLQGNPVAVEINIEVSFRVF